LQLERSIQPRDQLQSKRQTRNAKRVVKRFRLLLSTSVEGQTCKTLGRSFSAVFYRWAPSQTLQPFSSPVVSRLWFVLPWRVGCSERVGSGHRGALVGSGHGFRPPPRRSNFLNNLRLTRLRVLIKSAMASLRSRWGTIS